jgi:hypothetical protein
MCDHLICLLVLGICLKYQISPRALLLTKEDEAAEAGTQICSLLPPIKLLLPSLSLFRTKWL